VGDDPRGDRLGVRTVDVVDHDRGTCLGSMHGIRRTQTAAGTSDHHCFAVEEPRADARPCKQVFGALSQP
jgi:hypothetical protein